MRAFELAETLRGHKPALRVIISSGYGLDAFDPGKLSELGMVWLPKPYEPATLAQAVRECLDGLEKPLVPGEGIEPPTKGL